MDGNGLVRVEGARQLRSTMKRAALDLNELKASHARASAMVAQAAQPNTPRGKTGKLAGTVRAGATRREAIVRAGTARVAYANPIHWGWKKKNITAQPWLTDAARAKEPEWFSVYTAEIENILGTIEGA